MSEDLKPVGTYPAMKRLMAELAAKKAFARAHPELAAAWDEANQVDAAFEAGPKGREATRRRRELEADAPFQLGKLGVPQRAALAVRVVDLDRPALKYVRDFLAEAREKPLLALLGGPGVGKTVAAAYAVRTVLAANANPTLATGVKRREPMWVASAELAVLSSFTEADRLWFERMGDAAFLVLDDFGAEAMHDHAKARFERLIDLRYASGKATILTSNCDPESFSERAGQRVVDRFREAGRIVQCGDVSLRRRA